eukprot:9332272-Ditylum_brightwellii.AAC.1
MDDSTSASSVTDNQQPNVAHNPLEDAINEIKAKTEALEKLADEKKNMYNNMNTTALDNLMEYIDEKMDSNKETLLSERKTTSATTNDSLNKLL